MPVALSQTELVALSQAELDFIEQLGLVAESGGLTRITGRVWALLIVSGQALAPGEIAQQLQVSRASVGTSLKFLESLELLSIRSRAGERQSYFEMREHPYIAMMQLQARRAVANSAMVRNALKKISNPASRKGLEDLESFYSIVLDGHTSMLAQAGGAAIVNDVANKHHMLIQAVRQLLPLAALVLASCAQESDSQTSITPTAAKPTVTVTRIVQLPISERLTASGILLPREEAAVGAEVAGYQVAEVLVEEGAQVKKGQSLARLDSDLLRAQIDQAKAGLAQATAVSEQASAEADRVRDFDAKGAMSAEQIAARRYQARTSEAAVGVARAQLEQLLTQERKLEVRAPVDGIVLERSVRTGDVANLSEPLFRLARDGLVELDAEVTEDTLAIIASGDTATVSIPSGESIEGTVRLISPRVDPQTKLGRVRVSLPPNPQLRVGGYGRVSFNRPAVPVPAVAERAVQWEADGPRLITIDEHNRAHPVSVRTGMREAGFVALEQGPPVGTVVALGSGVSILEGDLVNPVEPERSLTAADTKPPR